MICPVPEDLPDRARWTGLKAIGVAISDTHRDGKHVGENRYYILSKFIAASRFADAVRATGVSRTVCIGNSTSPFRKTNAASAKATRTRTSASSAAPH